jgi:C4-dicarboxylate transporter DctM subunit
VTVVLLTLLGLLSATLLVGIWIGPALIGIGIVMLDVFTSRPTMRQIGLWSFNVLTSSEVVSLPLFILMGELLFRTRLSQSLFTGIAPWVGFLPGRLLHTTILGCSLFSAISGSSAATTQVVGRITLTELLRRGYNKDIAVGSLAGGGMLGFLIPLCGFSGGIAVAAADRELPAGLHRRRQLHDLYRHTCSDAARHRAGARPADVGMELVR